MGTLFNCLINDEKNRSQTPGIPGTPYLIVDCSLKKTGSKIRVRPLFPGFPLGQGME